MKKISLLLSAIIISVGASAQSFSAVYPFTDVTATSGTTDPTPVPTATGVTFGSFTAVGTPANPNATVRFSFTDWATGALASSDIYATHTGTINTAEYYEVTITPQSGYTLDLDTITFRVQRSGTGIRTFAVRSSLDSYTANLDAIINPANAALSVEAGNIFYWTTDATTSGQDGSTIVLDGSFTNLSTPVTFRFYGWNAEAAGGTFSIDNVVFSGAVTPPVVLAADFSWTAACIGDATDFTDLSVSPGTITNYYWDFGDGSPIDNSQNPSHTYAAEGTYNVMLAVTDDGIDMDTTYQSVTVNPAPNTMFLASATTVCFGTPVVFSDVSTISSGTIVSYSWDFGDPASGAANTSTLSSTTHNFATGGSHVVIHTTTSDMGCSSSAVETIYVDSVYALLPYTQSGMSATFAGSANGGTGPYTYELDPGDGSPSYPMPTVSHTYTVPGTYTACLMITDVQGCTDTTCVTVTALSIGIDAQAKEIISILPNPSTDGMFSLNLPKGQKASVVVYNIVGSKVLSMELDQVTNIIDLSAQVNGSYFISIRTDKETVTRKIIVSK